tara:strand:+ start:4501 stop:5364 length:864 start_codon:yes stop_codon:yes gene_type:complete
MRKIFIKSLVELNKKKKIYLIINDLGFNVVEPFQKKFPKKMYNAGVSEQNMMGMSAGIASEKNHVFAYSIGNFSTFRCAEQIRNDIDYHNLPVTIVSVGSGLGYGNLGYTHHSLQDYALMRSFQNILIISPGSNKELYASLKYIIKNPQPSYLRLDKDETKLEYRNNYSIKPGKLYKIFNGNRNKIILTTGNVQDIAQKLNKKKYSIFSLPIWGKKTKKITLNELKKFNEIITVEDHFNDAGFGSWVRECFSNTVYKNKIINKFIDDKVINDVGSKNYLMKKFGPKG